MGRGAWLSLSLAFVPGCGADSNDRSTAGGSGGSSSVQVADFCDAIAVIESKCQRCHRDPPENGAPFPLMTYIDTQAERSSTGALVYERMLDVVQAGTMPLTSLPLDPPVERLTCREKTTLLSWLREGAPRPSGNDPSCEGVEPQLLECPD